MKTSTLLMLGIGGVVAYEVLKGDKAAPLDNPLSLLTGNSPGGGLDLSGLFSGLGNMLGGLGGSGGGLLGGGLDLSGFQSAFDKFMAGLPGGGGGTGPAGPAGPAGQAGPGLLDTVNHAIDAPAAFVASFGPMFEGLGAGIKEAGGGILGAGQGLAIGAGSLAAFPAVLGAAKGIAPMLEGAGRAIAPAISRAAALASSSFVDTMAAPATLGAASIIGVPVAFGIGYGAGSLFNLTPPGKALLNASGNAGAAFSHTALGQKFFPVQGQLTDRSKSVIAQYGSPRPGESPGAFVKRVRGL